MTRHTPLSEEERDRLATRITEALATHNMSLNALAKQAGVDQGMAWRASHGRLTKRTPKVDRLELCVHIMLKQADARLAELDSSIRAYVAAGGSVDVLRSLIDALATAHRRERDG